MKHHITVDGEPVCASRKVRAAEMAAMDIGGGFTPRCGWNTEVSAVLEAARIARVLGQDVKVVRGECPVSARENEYDRKVAN